MNNTDCLPSEELKRRMIAEAAFYRSRKNPPAANPGEDWLAAEAEVEASLAAACGSAANESDLSAFTRFRKGFHSVLERTENTLRAGSLKKALARAAEEVRLRRERFPDARTKVSEKLRREFTGSAERLVHTWSDFKIKSGRLSAEWREKGARVLGRTSDSVHAWMKYWRPKDRN